MKELYIDFDGVILDTITPLYAGFKAAGISMDDLPARREYVTNLDFRTLVKDENILNDSINCINKLKESGLFQISILTHINSIDEGVVKVNYIRRYFKDITVILTPRSLDKTEMVHSEGSILVDDYSENLKIWKSRGGIPIKFSSEKKQREFISISKLDELIEINNELS